MKPLAISLLVTVGLGSLTVVSGLLATGLCLGLAAYGLRIVTRW